MCTEDMVHVILKNVPTPVQCFSGIDTPCPCGFFGLAGIILEILS